MLRSPTLNELPTTSSDKAGWPWTEETPQLPETMPDGSPWPRISVVTPSFNQGQFIEETIRSVLLQGYPNLEYIIIDGGSTDNTLEVIQKYKPWLAYWVSEQDKGQSHAINKGWKKCTGDVIAYICSDDFYFPNIFGTVAKEFCFNKEVGIVTGGIYHIDENSQPGVLTIPVIPVNTPTDLTLLDPNSWLLPQASTFISKGVLKSIGMWVREELYYTMDRELLYRAVRIAKVQLLSIALATYRHHSRSKTRANIIDSYEETRKSFALCNIGSENEKRLRSKILRQRIAQGYYQYAKSASGIEALYHFMKAAYLRPDYLTRFSFIKKAVKTSFWKYYD